MPRERIRQLLQELHGELEEAGSVDQESRDLLRAVMGDIREVLDREAAPEQAPAAGEEGLGDRLEEAAERFAGGHPQVVAVVKELMDGLNRLGI